MRKMRFLPTPSSFAKKILRPVISIYAPPARWNIRGHGFLNLFLNDMPASVATPNPALKNPDETPTLTGATYVRYKYRAWDG